MVPLFRGAQERRNRRSPAKLRLLAIASISFIAQLSVSHFTRVGCKKVIKG